MDAASRSRSLHTYIRDRQLDLLVLSTLATLVFLQAYRVFVPYLVFEVDQSERQTLAKIAVTVFALAFLGTVLHRFLGARWTLVLATTGMVVSRLTLQFTADAEYRWMFGAASIVTWAWLMTVILPQRGPAVPIGVGLSLGLDLSLRALRSTLDLPWMPGTLVNLASMAIAGGIAIAAYSIAGTKQLQSPESDSTSSLRFIGIGPGLALWLVLAGNLGFAREQAGVGAAAAFGMLALGVLAALVLAQGFARWRSQRHERMLITALGLLGIVALAIWNSDTPRWLDLIFLPLLAGVITLLTMRCASPGSLSEHAWRWRTGAALTIGLLLQTGFIFAYFARSGTLLLLALPIAIMTITGLAGNPAPALTGTTRATLQRATVAMAVASLVIFGWLFFEDNQTGSTTLAEGSLTVMTFNIQEGFSNEKTWSLEETARTIEAYDPDIVLLQEITRGWLVMSSVDEVPWLAERLDMEFAYAGNSYDGLWGNAILSKLPIESTRSTTFSTTDNLRRGAVAVEVAVPNGNLLVIDTHLDNPKKAIDVRLQQIDELLAFWHGTTPAIIGGDFNADPGSPEWDAMLAGGLVDAAGNDPTTTSEDERRIDYIFVTPDLQVDSYQVPEVWTSDHRPVVVEISF